MSGFPAVVDGATDAALIASALAEHDAVVVTRTGLDANGFRDLSALVFGGLGAGTGEHPEASEASGVFTPVEFAATEKLLWHNENSFEQSPPAFIGFLCTTPAAVGGETPIVRGRDVHRALANEIVDRFEESGVRYVRRFLPGIGRTWQEVFQTSDRDAVTETCNGQELDFRWDGDVLTTTATRTSSFWDGTEHHWFNQAQHWHPACLPTSVRRSIKAVFGDRPPRECRFGDDSPIPDEWMHTIVAAYAEHEVARPWQAGDILFVDNLRVAHGRNPYQGPRQHYVALGPSVRVDAEAASGTAGGPSDVDGDRE